MPNQKIDSVKKEFIKYLDLLGLSPISHKNYRSDLGYFISWAILKIRSFGAYVESLTEVVPFLNTDLGREFKRYMSENAVPHNNSNHRRSRATVSLATGRRVQMSILKKVRCQ